MRIGSLRISIHAPAKGATLKVLFAVFSRLISIHAPAKGATHFLGQQSVEKIDFNPRSREGSDDSTDGNGNYEYISIHAPAKGATRYQISVVIGSKFQSTLPRRERRGRYARGWCSRHFNPRSREGSDLTLFLSAPCRNDFNPRSREGSDKAGITGVIVRADFNPRSREGSDG